MNLTKLKLTRIPYFYIIRNINSGIKYAGSKFSVDASPELLLKLNGYPTSSPIIHRIISAEGLDSFEILEIKTDVEDVYKYETEFLTSNDCASSYEWYNCHNNTGVVPYGTDAHRKFMFLKYGVEHISKLQSHKDRISDVNMNKRAYNDGKRNYWVLDGEEPKDFMVDGFLSQSTGSEWCTNGLHEFKLEKDETLPSGYYRGRTFSTSINKLCYNNEFIELYFSIDEIAPVGFSIGGLRSHNPPKLKFWINNSIKETYIDNGSDLPEGYVLGRIKKELAKINCEHCKQLVIVSMYKQHHGKYCKLNKNREIKVKPKFKCRFCSKETLREFDRYHGDNCKLKQD